MPPILALILCLGLITLLLWIERKRNPLSSLALWIPTSYMLIEGSRPIGSWFEQGTLAFEYMDLETMDLETGSPVSQLVLIALLLFSLLVLYGRKTKWPLIFKDNFTLIFLFIFLGISILWSDHEFVSIKRWIRLAETIPIAMVVLSERSPLAAMESIFRRCAYVLVPLSIVLIKYYPHMGVLYGRWSGMPMWIGATPDKNSLAQLCVLSILFIIWAFFRERRAKNLSRARSVIYADSLVFAIAIFLLFGSGTKGSATSEVVLIVGSASLLLLYGMYNSAGRIAVYLVFAAVLMWPILIFCDSIVPEVTSVLGRDASFTGRTEIWQQGMQAAMRHPILGTGFGAYWGLGKQLSEVWGGNEGHNGLLDVFVEVGIVGVTILLAFLLSFYKRVCREFNHSFDWGIFGICFLIISLLSNYTESLFLKSTSFYWNSMIFLTIVFSAPYLEIKENGSPIKNASLH